MIYNLDMKNDVIPEFFSILEFAQLIKVHPNTIRNMIKNGRLCAFRVGGGRTSSYRISKSEIHRISVLDLENIIQDIVDKRMKEKLQE
jgi:excisionase family DNA binding protein